MSEIRVVQFDESRVDQVFAAIDRSGLPGAAIGIAVNGRPVYRKGFGAASMELPVALSPSIRMRIGSTTKHFAAFAYLLLCEQGLAGVDDPIGKYLPELHPVARAVTARQLMSNTSGLRDAIDVRFQFSGATGRYASREELLDLYRRMDDVSAEPGSSWIYNNGGWMLLSIMIERIAGRPFEEAMRERVFAPIGMHDTLVRRLDTDFVPNSATPHATGVSGRLERLFWDMDFAGAGMIASTVNDMLRWAAHMDAPHVGARRTWDLLKTPQTLSGGASTGYGMGLIASRYRGLEVIHHPGGGVGCNAQLLKAPSIGLDVVAMVNCDDISAVRLVHDVLDACVTGLDPVTPPEWRPVTGAYWAPETGRVVQLFERDGSQVISVDGLDLPAAPDRDGVLWPTIDAAWFRFGVELVGDRASPHAVRLNDFGRVEELISLALPETPGGDRIVGRYRSDGADAEVTISSVAEGVRLSAVGGFGSTDSALEQLGETVWRAKSLGLVKPSSAILSFDHEARGFTYSTNLTRALPFRRLA